MNHFIYEVGKVIVYIRSDPYYNGITFMLGLTLFAILLVAVAFVEHRTKR